MKAPQIDYTKKDYQTLLSTLKEKINYYLPEWTDHNDSDFGIAVLQLLSYSVDILHYYLDRMANEAYLSTATKRQNVINLLKLIDYKMAGAIPATVDLTFTLGQIFGEDVTIPAGTECQSVTDESLNNEVVYFNTNEDLVITAGNLSGDVSATEGQSGSETLGISDGNAYQQFNINASPIFDGTLKVLVDSVEWSEVDSLALSEADAMEYYVQRDEDDKITVFFGDDSQGKIPPNGTEITCSFLVGGAIRGNLGPNTITIINSTILHQGSPIAVSVTNNNAASGGEGRETTDHAKTQATLELRTLNRCVTEDDYEALAKGYTGVARAKCSPIEPKSYRIIDLYIVPNGGGFPSEALKTGLQSYLEEKRMVLDMLTIQDPQYVTIDVEGTVYVKNSYVQTVVENAVMEALDNFFAYDSEYMDFGRGIYLSDLYRLLDEIEGVDHVDLGSQMANVSLNDFEFPQKGTVNLTFVGGT